MAGQELGDGSGQGQRRQWPPTVTSTSSAQSLGKDAPLELQGTSRSSRAARNLVGPGGQRRPGVLERPPRLLNLGAGPRQGQRLGGGIVEVELPGSSRVRGSRPGRSAYSRAADACPVSAHHSSPVSPGAGVIALSRTIRSTSRRSQTRGAVSPPMDCPTTVPQVLRVDGLDDAGGVCLQTRTVIAGQQIHRDCRCSDERTSSFPLTHHGSRRGLCAVTPSRERSASPSLQHRTNIAR